ncbi:TetR/AcrR family transcriptional regulator [Magnetovibrio sp.]|uniref:TetR/AcrR family transcriptional regulator n=1 Tax=Magnetovibrio sp. TaxID=2024836 RepID=UPI002F951EB4
MARNGNQTRENIMNAAQALILQQGFSATSVDSVIEGAGITKGTFFYHFKAKSELASALVARYARLDAEHLDGDLARAEGLSRDPLQQILILVGLFREEMAGLTEPFPGCLYASFCYEAGLFDDETLGHITGAFAYWRERLEPKFTAIIDAHPPRYPVSADELTDMLLGIFEGAFILSQTWKDPAIIMQQLGHYRNYIELLFSANA